MRARAAGRGGYFRSRQPYAVASPTSGWRIGATLGDVILLGRRHPRTRWHHRSGLHGPSLCVHDNCLLNCSFQVTAPETSAKFRYLYNLGSLRFPRWLALGEGFGHRQVLRTYPSDSSYDLSCDWACSCSCWCEMLYWTCFQASSGCWSWQEDSWAPTGSLLNYHSNQWERNFGGCSPWADCCP